MRFAVVRHPDAGLGVVAESALPLHRAKGWARVSDWGDEDQVSFDLVRFVDAPDLDAEPDPVELPAPDQADAKAAKNTKEKS